MSAAAQAFSQQFILGAILLMNLWMLWISNHQLIPKVADIGKSYYWLQKAGLKDNNKGFHIAA